MKDFLQHLNIKVIRPEGDNQLLCECPWCGKKKLYVDIATGLWKCQVGCDQGNPKQLVEKLTSLDPKGVASLLDQHGLLSSDHQAVTPKQAKKPHIRLTKDECCPMSGEELRAFCKIKNIDPEAYKKVMGLPWRHATEPWILMPAYDPSNPNEDKNLPWPKACGVLRAHLEGKLIPTKEGPKKYPQVLGSHIGLFGVPWLIKEKPKEIDFTEGWRDCLAAVEAGFYATASSGGASGTWKDSWLPLFEDRTVYITMDCDSAGNGGPLTNEKTGKVIQKEGQANLVARKIFPVAKHVKILRLPYKHQERNGKDLHDFLYQIN